MMPNPKRDLSNKHAARAAVVNAGQPCGECQAVLPAHAETCSLFIKPPVDLDDAATQKAILAPQPFVVTIGGAPVELYPLPASAECAFTMSLMPDLRDVIAARGELNLAAYVESDRGLALTDRYAVALADSPELRRRFTRLVARAELPPDADVEDDDEAVVARAKAINRTMKQGEVYFAFAKMVALNEMFFVPKPRLVSATSTS
jgi:hypothetical protein